MCNVEKLTTSTSSLGGRFNFFFCRLMDDLKLSQRQSKFIVTQGPFQNIVYEVGQLAKMRRSVQIYFSIFNNRIWAHIKINSPMQPKFPTLALMDFINTSPLKGSLIILSPYWQTSHQYHLNAIFSLFHQFLVASNKHRISTSETSSLVFKFIMKTSQFILFFMSYMHVNTH